MRKAGGDPMTLHDKNQIARKLKGKSAKPDLYIKYSKANGNQKISPDTWTKGGITSQNGFQKTDNGLGNDKGVPSAHQ